MVTPFRVGLLVLGSAVLLFVFLTFVRKGGLSKSEAQDVYAYFRDASGLSRKSTVRIAGIRVGDIQEIVLEGTRARVKLRVRRDVGLREDATLTKRSESLLGDYVLDLTPGSDNAPALPDSAFITHVVDQEGMQAIFGTLEKITGDIQEVTGALRDALGGKKGANSLEKIVDNMTRLSESMDQTVRQSGESLQVILGNAESVSRDLRGITRGEDQNIRTIVENITYITRDVRDVMGTVKNIVGANEGDLKESVSSLKDTMSKLDRSLANLEEVTTKVKEGKGPVGKLLTDERLGQKLSETVEDVSDFASHLTRLQAEVGIKSEYLFAEGNAKNTLGIRLIPRPDKYYLLEFIDDPRGSVSTETVQNNPPAAGQPATQVRAVTTNALKFSAEFAKRYYFATLRFGIIESTGGVGADLHFFSDMLTFKVDAFNFSIQELRYPRLRATLRFQFLNHLFASGGMDDILNAPVRDSITNRLTSGRDFFLGGGIYFTDEDLKSILTVAPVPKP